MNLKPRMIHLTSLQFKKTSSLALKEIREIRDPKVIEEIRDLKVIEEIRDLKVIKVTKVIWVMQEL